MGNSTFAQHFSGNVVPETICGDPTQRKSTFTTKTRGTASLVAEANREDVREVFLSQGFDNDTVDILITSWKKAFSPTTLHI